MTQTDVYNRIFEYPRVDVNSLVLTDPDQVERGSKSRETTAWELLLGSMQLRRAGQRSLPQQVRSTRWCWHRRC